MANGRPRKPVSVKEINGTYNSSRDSDRNTESLALSKRAVAPKDLGKEGKIIWLEVYEKSKKWGTLADTDILILTKMADYHQRAYDAWEEFKNETDFGNRRRLAKESAMWSDKVDKLLKDFGFTPVDRERVHPNKEEGNDDFMDGLV
jgi:phage terminase small subunit